MLSRLAVLAALATGLALAHGAQVPLPAPTPVVVDGSANTTTPAPPRTPPPSPAAAKTTTDTQSVAPAPKPHHKKRVAAAPAAAPGAGAAADCAAAHQWGATTLPAIIIRTATPGRLTRNKTRAFVAVCAPDGSVDWAGAARARVRGGTNSQKRNVVLQYALTDFAAGGDGAATSNNGTHKGAAALAGMPPGKQFILLGQSVDPLGVKAWAGLELARVMPALEANTSSTTSPPLGWTPRAKFVELFMIDDGAPFSPSSHYLGTRVLAEHIEPGANRVPLGPGGWIANFLHGEPDPEGTPLPAAVTAKEWMIKYPTKPNMPAATLAAATATLAAFERGAIDRVGDWRVVADEVSFVDWFVVMELIKATKVRWRKECGKMRFCERTRVQRAAVVYFFSCERQPPTCFPPQHTYHSAAFSHVLSSSAPRLRMGPIWNVVSGGDRWGGRGGRWGRGVAATRHPQPLPAALRPPLDPFFSSSSPADRSRASVRAVGTLSRVI